MYTLKEIIKMFTKSPDILGDLLEMSPDTSEDKWNASVKQVAKVNRSIVSEI